ncbi:YHYH domain-containing protein [Kangiella sediminilitoris]|nr:YHYH domain-containing protein [Kangiella sediminilitoris]
MILAACLCLFVFAADGHSGRLDKNGGHNCSKKSKEKGLCSGYHYHRAASMAHSHDGEVHSHIPKSSEKKNIVGETPSI